MPRDGNHTERKLVGIVIHGRQMCVDHAARERDERLYGEGFEGVLTMS